jgi:cysteine sulfinate desulfinase/cysteine desulfurase-like protein
MEKKKGRGRPRVTEKIAGEHSVSYEKVITGGKQYRSRRSISDTAYGIIAAGILLEAASDIEDLEFLINDQSQYICRSILNQLGRMHRTEGYSKENIIRVAKATIQDKKNGYSVKEIEQYIRNGRVTGEW